jgi:hypothetical protein
MNLKNRMHPALLAILAMIAVALTLVAGKGSPAAGVAEASAPNVANSPLKAQSPNSVWSVPVPVLFSTGYDNRAMIAASPVNGAVTFLWGAAPSPDDGLVVEASNTVLNGPFTAELVDSNEPGLNEGVAAAADNLGRRHVVYWDWPRGGTLCDYYAIIGLDGHIQTDEQIPGSCDPSFPRKLAGLAIDNNNTAHIVLGRNGQNDSLRYWERTAAGTWPVQYEYVAQNCCPGDLSLAVSSQGVVMVAFKSTGIYGAGTDIYTVTRNGPDNWNVADDISANCCNDCPQISGAYLPSLIGDYTGGIRAVWSDGRCYPGGQTDIYYREWVPGTGWNNQPLVQVTYNSGISYWPDVAVDGSGEAHIAFSDDTSSPINYYRIFYVHGRGTSFSGVEIPFTPWDRNSSWQKESFIAYAAGYLHLAFSANRDDPNKNNYYSNRLVAAPPTPTPIATATPVPPRCTGQQFKDVCPGDYFYTATQHLVDAGIISGYNTSPPCLNNLWVPCFNPYSNATRAQIAKVVVLAADMPINTQGFPHFQDVSASNVFSTYVETAFNAGVIGGYPCGSVGEPCVPPGNRPYFRPNNLVTRGQITKMAAIAFGITDPPSGQTFQDVPPGSTFYTYTEQIADLGIINGYPCGGVLEPCIPPGNRPYYRPNNSVTRGQAVKILDGFRQLLAPTPTATMPSETATPIEATVTPTGVIETPTPEGTGTPTETPTTIPTATETPALRT